MEVLIRLVKAHPYAERAQMSSLELTHRRVHQIDGQRRSGTDVSSRVDELELRAASEGFGDARCPFGRAGLAGLHEVHKGRRETGLAGQLADGPSLGTSRLPHL